MKEQTNKTPVASASRHTPEPWTLDADEKIRGADKFPVFTHRSIAEALSTKARVRDCVNALAGMNPEAVKDVVKALEDMLAPFEGEANWQVEQARAALAALKGGGE